MAIHVIAVLILAASAQATPQATLAHPLGRVHGTVVAAHSGLPLRGVTLMLSEVAGTAKDAPPTISHGYARTSDHQGRFTFRGVPAGRYTLRATRVPPPFLAGAPSDAFQVADGQTFDAGFVRLRRGGAISGRITDERGMPVTNMPVAAIRVSTSDPAARRYDAQPTDDRGHFRIYGLEDDDYYVIAQPPRGAAVEADAQEEAPAADSFVPTLHPSATDPAAAVRVRVRAGEDVLDIDIRIAEGRLARLRGRLIDSRGAPLPGTLGYVTHASNRVTRFPGIGFNTDDQGRFEIAGLWPGNYRLSARTLPDFSSDAANRRPTEVANTPVVLGEQDRRTADLRCVRN